MSWKVAPIGRGGDLLYSQAGTPSLDLRFAENKALTDYVSGTNLIDFTRASSGTYVGSDGLIKTATTNLFTYSESVTSGWALTNTNVTSNFIAAPDGTITADLVVGTGSGDFINKIVTVKSGAIVAYSVYVKYSNMDWVRLTFLNGANEVRAWFNVANGTVGTVNTSGIATSASASIQNIGDGWYRCALFGAIPGAASYTFYNTTAFSDASFTRVTGGERYLWGAQLEQSSTVGEYIPTTSTINSAPRFDHDPTTGESLGLLVEESRTNLLARSEEFGTTWSAIRSSISGDSAVAPNGSVTADKLIEDTTETSTHAVQQTGINYVSGLSYTFSCYVKEAGRQSVRLSFSAAAFTTNIFGHFNLANGSVTSSSLDVTPTITAVGNGWYRCSVTATATASASAGATIFIGETSDSINVSFSGDGISGIYLWGAQLEEGSFPTSYIPTEGTTVTRAADVASISGSNFSSWYRQDEGTVFVEGAVPVGVSSTRALLSIDDGTNAERIQIRHNGTTARAQLVVDNNTVQFSAAFVGNSFPPGEYRKLAMAVKANDFAAVTDDAGTIDTGTGAMPTLTQLQIGNAPGNPQPCKPIKRITFWPARLPNETLSTITQ